MTKRTDDILKSMDGMSRAEAPQQFYAGIRAKMERQSPAERISSFSWKPVFVTAALFVFLFINIFALNFFNRQTKTTEKQSSGIQAFADEYHLGTQGLDQ